MANRRRRRRVRLKPAGVLVLLIFVIGIVYIFYVAVTDWGMFSGAAPASALADEGDAEPEDSAPLADSTPEFSLETDAHAQPEGAGGSSDTNVAPPEVEANVFEQFLFYMPEKLAEYEAFAREDASLSPEDVVWMVNAGLNRPFFENPNVVTDPNPLLVNPYNRIPDSFVPLALEEIDGDGRLATPETISAFNGLREGALQDGISLSVTSAYRTIEYQRGLYEREDGDGSVARPGFSEHHTGRALDLWGPYGLLDQEGPSDTGRWVAAHAHEYGFIVRYTEANRHITGYISEPWHITYVGSVIAWEIYNDGYGSLEEYVAKNIDASL